MSAHDEQQAELLDKAANLPRFVSEFDDRFITALRAGAAALRRASPETGWQDISTAPKDGTEILMNGPEGLDIGAWDEGRDDEKESGVIVEPGYAAGWLGARHYWSEDRQPTHWQPLPPAPRPQ